ncbi:hypothetical protein BH09BAC3_BH09BAC3_12980 [soil metagenome]
MPETSVIFIYDHFYPDFTAGGPITSLSNLSKLLGDKISIKVLTSAYQYTGHKPLSNIVKDKWTTWKDLPVWYASDRTSITKAFNDLANEAETIIYLNGIFSLDYFLLPLRLSIQKGLQVIITPRGMLQAGALARGALKKKVFIAFLRLSGLLKNVTWHATDAQEANDIRAVIGSKAPITIIPNVPVVRSEAPPAITKDRGELKLVYYSLISEKKNLLFLVSLLGKNDLAGIHLDIIGPIKDEGYWQLCLKEILKYKLADRVKYLGEVHPQESLSYLSAYHALVLPTHGENFGHAIVESFAASRPVIISDKTPWTDVEVSGAGFSLPLEESKWLNAFQEMLTWEESDFKIACTSALDYYHHKFDFEKLKSDYIKLFLNPEL